MLCIIFFFLLFVCCNAKLSTLKPERKIKKHIQFAFKKKKKKYILIVWIKYLKFIFALFSLQYPEPNRPWPGGSSPAPSPGPGGHPLPPASPHHPQHGGPPPSSSPSHAPSPSPQPSQASPSPHQVSEILILFIYSTTMYTLSI